MDSTKPPIQWVPEVLSPGEIQQGREVVSFNPEKRVAVTHRRGGCIDRTVGLDVVKKSLCPCREMDPNSSVIHTAA